MIHIDVAGGVVVILEKSNLQRIPRIGSEGRIDHIEINRNIGNMANSLYKQKKYEEAGKIFNSIAEKSEDNIQKAQAYHNLGNSYLKSKQIDHTSW